MGAAWAWHAMCDLAFSVLFSRENHVSNPEPYCTDVTGMIPWMWGLGYPRLFTL
jgi:hypothetical protein